MMLKGKQIEMAQASNWGYMLTNIRNLDAILDFEKSSRLLPTIGG